MIGSTLESAQNYWVYSWTWDVQYKWEHYIFKCRRTKRVPFVVVRWENNFKEGIIIMISWHKKKWVGLKLYYWWVEGFPFEGEIWWEKRLLKFIWNKARTVRDISCFIYLSWMTSREHLFLSWLGTTVFIISFSSLHTHVNWQQEDDWFHVTNWET